MLKMRYLIEERDLSPAETLNVDQSRLTKECNLLRFRKRHESTICRQEA